MTTLRRALLHGALEVLPFFCHFGDFLPIWRFWQLFGNFFWLILILGQFVITPYCNIFWENSQSEIEARRVSWSLFLYILQALECFTLYSKAFFLHYLLLFFNFWVKIRPMFVKIWFRININWHNLVKSAKKKNLVTCAFIGPWCALFPCWMLIIWLFHSILKLVSASLWIQRLIPSEIFVSGHFEKKTTFEQLKKITNFTYI